MGVKTKRSSVFLKSALFHLNEVPRSSWKKFQASLNIFMVPFRFLCMAFFFPSLLYFNKIK